MLAEKANLPLSVCPLCHGTGLEVVPGKGARRCACRTVRQTVSRTVSARIPKRYEDCTLESYFPLNSSTEAGLMYAKTLSQEYPEVEAGLLLIGPCGVGKTHLAVAILQALLEKNVGCLFYDFRDLLKEIQDSWNRETQASEMQILASIYDAEVLVLDELGASKPTEWVKDTMTHIITKRYNDRKVTVITSNYMDTKSGPYDETLTERVGERLRSRLHEMCKVVPVVADDYRRGVKQAGIRFGGK